jgi:hypothetical protein
MSLQFFARCGYFSALGRRWSRWIFLVLLAGCGERDRLTFPVENPGNGSGPITVISRPEAADTEVSADQPLVISGFSTDPDGVYAVFFQVAGAGFGFSPLNGEGMDTVHFAIQVPTLSAFGDTIFIQISATDVVGDSGLSANRRIRVH